MIGTAALLLGPAAGVASAGGAPALGWSPTTSPGTFSYGTVNLGQPVSQVFTLTNSGGSGSGAVKVALTGSAAFTKTADSCTGNGLGPKKSCSVTVAFAPATAGETDSATLTAASGKATATLALRGAAPLVSPTITTSPGAGGTVGSTVTDTATLSGGSSPTGTVTFNLYGPSQTANCSATAAVVDTETVPVSGNGAYTTPAGAKPLQTGTYWWVASYGGDSTNNPAASNCGDESVTITPALYWTTFAGNVVEAGLDGSNPHVIFPGSPNLPRTLAVNSSHLYWANAAQTGGTIVEANLDGSNPQAIVTGHAPITAVAVDGSHLYWLEGSGDVWSAGLDGSNPTQIAPSQGGGGGGIAAANGQLYWDISGNDGAIFEAGADGSNPHVIDPGQNIPQGIVATGSNLYWGVDIALVEANLDGSNAHVIEPNQLAAGVAANSSTLYWANGHDGTVWEAGLDGSNPQQIVAGAASQGGAFYIAVGS